MHIVSMAKWHLILKYPEWDAFLKNKGAWDMAAKLWQLSVLCSQRLRQFCASNWGFLLNFEIEKEAFVQETHDDIC